jgi:hypothetical protein
VAVGRTECRVSESRCPAGSYSTARSGHSLVLSWSAAPWLPAALARHGLAPSRAPAGFCVLVPPTHVLIPAGPSSPLLRRCCAPRRDWPLPPTCSAAPPLVLVPCAGLPFPLGPFLLCSSPSPSPSPSPSRPPFFPVRPILSVLVRPARPLDVLVGSCLSASVPSRRFALFPAAPLAR